METMDLEVSQRVARLTFTRPDRLNSITEEVIDDLDRAVDEVEADEEIRVLVIRGSGKAFSVGLDLDLLRRAFDDAGYFESVIRKFNDVLLRFDQIEAPVIASVNGLARAGGFELMLAADLSVVVDEARIGDNHTQVGVMPGGGSTQRLPRLIGEQRAKAIIFTAEWMSGAEAAEAGIALRSCPLDRLDDEVSSLCDQLVDKPRGVHGAVKRAMRIGRGLPIDQGISAEIAEFKRWVLGGDEAREGFLASMERRSPRWR